MRRQTKPTGGRRLPPGEPGGAAAGPAEPAADAVHEARLCAEAIVETVREPLIVLDADLRVVSASRAFCATYGLTPEETGNRLLYELGNGQWNIPGLRGMIADLLPKKRTVVDFEVTHHFPAIGTRTLLLNGRVLARKGDRSALILLAIEDISGRRQAERALRESAAGRIAVADAAADGRRLERAVADRVKEEQQAFSRELHDGVAQHLAAAGMTGAALHKRLEAESSPQAGEAAKLNQLIRGAQEEVRALIRGVRPVDVTPTRLVHALRDLTTSAQERHGVACALETSDAAALTDAKTATQLYYIAAEAVHNAIRHAAPGRIVVRLATEEAALVLEVRDDGTSIARPPPEGGLGLQIMAYRAGLIGAFLDVGAAHDGGTLVRCVLPLPGGELHA